MTGENTCAICGNKPADRVRSGDVRGQAGGVWRGGDVMAWQPIETAPKDGTIVILSDGRCVHPGAWAPAVQGDSYPWIFVEDLTGAGHQPAGCCDREDASRIEVNAWAENGPSHWMLLPSAPGQS